MLPTEAAVVYTLKAGSYTQQEIYEACEQLTNTARDGGHDPVPGHPGDRRWKRRARGAQQWARRKGLASLVDGKWRIHGTPERPVRLLLIVTGATPLEFDLRLQAATEMLADLDQPVDLVLADPPYALGRGEGRHYANGHGYRRDHTKIVGGYVDIDPAEYADFTAAWIEAAARALRPGGQLAVVTGPQRTGVVQVAAESAGLTYVCKIAAGRQFPARAVRRPAHAHWDINVMVRGPVTHRHRVFNPPQDLPQAHSGGVYPLDWWPAEFNGRSDRPRQMRYDNSLPYPLVIRIVRAFSNPGEFVAEPFLGGGSGLIACYDAGRNYAGCDVNHKAVQYAGARLLDERLTPAAKAPALFEYHG